MHHIENKSDLRRKSRAFVLHWGGGSILLRQFWNILLRHLAYTFCLIIISFQSKLVCIVKSYFVPRLSHYWTYALYIRFNYRWYRCWWYQSLPSWSNVLQHFKHLFFDSIAISSFSSNAVNNFNTSLVHVSAAMDKNSENQIELISPAM